MVKGGSGFTLACRTDAPPFRLHSPKKIAPVLQARFTLTGALSLLYRYKVARKVPKKSLGSTCVPSFSFIRENKFPQKCSMY